MIITVKFMHRDSGFCRDYYRVVKIQNEEGETKEPKNLIICKQEEMKDCFVWYRTSSDGVWNEPEATIKTSATIVDESDVVLRHRA